MSHRVEQLQHIQYQAKNLFEKKNKDYGDAFATYGTVGVLVRIGDKINRLINITANGITLINNEGLRDTLIDLHNYAAMAIMLLDEESDADPPQIISPPPPRLEHPRVKSLRVETADADLCARIDKHLDSLDTMPSITSRPPTIFSPRRGNPNL